MACTSSVPKDVLPPSKMRSVLWDVMQADELAGFRTAKDSTYASLAKHAAYYDAIFKIHKIDKERFDKSLTYYENHPAAFKIIFDSLQSLAERRLRPDSIKKPKKPVIADSILHKRVHAL
jgi:hypothetical protein